MPARPERVAVGAIVAGLALSLLLGVGLRDQIACGLVEASVLTMIAPNAFADADEAARDGAGLLELARQAGQRADGRNSVTIFTASSFWLGDKPRRTIRTPLRSCFVIGPAARDELARLADPAPPAPAAPSDSPTKADILASPNPDPAPADPPPAAPATPAAAPSESRAPSPQESAALALEPSKPAEIVAAPEPPKQTETPAPAAKADPPMPPAQAAAPDPPDDPPRAKSAPGPKAPELSDPPTGSVAARAIRPGRRFLAMRASREAPAIRHVRPAQTRRATPPATHSPILPPGWRRMDTPNGLLYLSHGGFEGRCSTDSTNGSSICRVAPTRR